MSPRQTLPEYQYKQTLILLFTYVKLFVSSNWLLQIRIHYNTDSMLICIWTLVEHCCIETHIGMNFIHSTEIRKKKQKNDMMDETEKKLKIRHDG